MSPEVPATDSLLPENVRFALSVINPAVVAYGTLPLVSAENVGAFVTVRPVAVKVVPLKVRSVSEHTTVLDELNSTPPAVQPLVTVLPLVMLLLPEDLTV